MYVNTENGQIMSICAIFISILGMGDNRKTHTHNYCRIRIVTNITKNFVVTYSQKVNAYRHVQYMYYQEFIIEKRRSNFHMPYQKWAIKYSEIKPLHLRIVDWCWLYLMQAVIDIAERRHMQKY